VTDSIVQTPVISTIGPHAPIPFQNIKSQIAASSNGKLIAASGSSSTVGVYNFNNSTGKLSNYRTIRLGAEIVTSLCFSPGSSKLYIATIDSKGCQSYSKLFQVDLNGSDLNKSLFLVKQYLKRSLELSKAKDNRIWIKNVAYPATGGTYFEVIEYPDLPKNACVIKEKYLKYGASVGLPNVINNYIQRSTISSITKLNLPDTLYSCSGHIRLDAGPGYEMYIWNTGDSTRSIQVTQPGLYTVLAGKKGLVQPEAYGHVYVKSKAASAFNTEDTTFCPKTLQVLKVPSNITNILWMDGDTSRIKPVQNQQYKLTGIDNNGCIVRDSICVNIHDNPVVSFGRDTTFCSPAQLQLTLKSYIDSVSPGNVKTSSFLWQDGSTNNSFTVKQAGSYWGSIQYNGCTVADTINVKYVSIPNTDLGNDTSLCDGNPISLYVQPSDAKYIWSTGNVANSITVDKTGIYWVRVSKDICVNSDTVQVVYKPNPVVSLPKDTAICEGTSLTLSTPLDPSYAYKWQNGDSANSISVTKAATYSVTAGLNGCFASDSVTIGVIQKPVILLSDTVLCKGTQMILEPHVAATDNVVWVNAVATHEYRVTTPGIYPVEASNKCGSDSKNIRVTEKLCRLIMPTAFTPNHDNLNDVFMLKYPELVKEFHFIVYNRLGQKIFETTNSRKGWDGNLNGIPQPMGTYVWSINYTDADNNKEFSKGYVVLLR
jgi:gliding motility-associated-like protein